MKNICRYRLCMGLEALNWALKKNTDTPTTKLVLLILANYANEQGISYPSEKHLAARVGVSDRQVRRCIKWLTENNFLAVQPRKGTSNNYILSMDTDVHPPRTPTSTNTKDDTKEYTSDFQEFWKMYPRKVGKFVAFKSFLKAIKSHDVKPILRATFNFAEQHKLTEQRFIPHAQTYLNQKRFLDKIEKPIKNNSLNNLAG